MSTSPSHSSAAAAAPVPAKTSREAEAFPYETIPLGTHRPRHPVLMDGGTDGSSAEQASREAQARALGRNEGREEARRTLDEQMLLERAKVATALAEFRSERATYFQRVEAEVVQLALSIARKILHREAQLDPLLLAGIVRVALEKIDRATRVVLRLHPQNAPEWRRYFTTHLEPANVPEIVEDAAQPADRCALETSMGTSALGLEVQLKEIEQGFTDLLAARPRGAS